MSTSSSDSTTRCDENPLVRRADTSGECGCGGGIYRKCVVVGVDLNGPKE